MNFHQERLYSLRQVLKKRKLDAFIIPNTDRWRAEHPAPCDQRLRFLTGLEASAGYAVVTQDQAVVLVDGRYTLSAQDQVDQSLFTLGDYTETLPEIWAIEALGGSGVIGYDPWLHTRKEAKRMQKACNAMGVVLQAVSKNPVDKIWHDRPAPPAMVAMAHDVAYAGRTIGEKCHDVADILTENETDSVIITAPDSIAWLLNLRVVGNSIAPGIPGFLIFDKPHHHLTLFTDVNCQALDHDQMGDYKTDIFPLDDFPMAVHHLEQSRHIIQIPNQAPDWLTDHLNAPACRKLTRIDPIETLKAIKNTTEQEGIRAAHHRDALAMKHVITWIKSAGQITEKQIESRLIEERQKQDLYHGVSFDSIVGWNANGAKIHGSPTDMVIEGDGLLLIDSGGQYQDGTTDITRTIAIGTPTQEMKEKFTLVLKAHIALAMAIFPQGTTGAQLDAITRQNLWHHGLNYAHGTGHGVGHFLNVHEGPYGIPPRSDEPIKAGMLLSNEPGYYKEGAFGIRHENLILAQPHPDYDGFLYFETVTKVPFDEDAILWEMLSTTEKEWLEDYQKDSSIL